VFTDSQWLFLLAIVLLIGFGLLMFERNDK